MKLTHPDSSLTIEVAPGDADRYQSQGWVRPAPKKATTDRASGDQSGTAPQTTTKKEEA